MTRTAVKWSTLLVACMPIFSLKAMVWILLTWAICVLAHQFKSKQPFAPNSRSILYLSGIFILVLLNAFRGDDPSSSWHDVERSTSLLIVPFVFLGLAYPQGLFTRKRIFDIFGIAALVLACWANLVLFMKGHLDLQELSSGKYREAFGAELGIHPLYASYFFLTGALFGLRNISQLPRDKGYRLVLIASLVMFSFLCASRMPLIAFIVAGVYYLMNVYRSYFRILLLPALFAVVMLLFMMPSIGERMLQLHTWNVEQLISEGNGALAQRLNLHDCTIELLKEKWLVGVGTGNAYPQLGTCFDGRSGPVDPSKPMNTHSQILHYWLELGLPGLLLFAALFLHCFQVARKKKDRLHCAFLIFMLLCMLTENILSRQLGILLFVFWNTFFYVSRTERWTPNGIINDQSLQFSPRS